jgi:hypothetical protein
MQVLIVTDIIILNPGIEDIGKYGKDGFEIVLAGHGIPDTAIIMADRCNKDYLINLSVAENQNRVSGSYHSRNPAKF